MILTISNQMSYLIHNFDPTTSATDQLIFNAITKELSNKINDFE